MEKTEEASLAADERSAVDDGRRLARLKSVDTVDAMDGFVRRDGVLAGSTWNCGFGRVCEEMDAEKMI